jgi:flagellar hook-associated protein 1 FlgK
LQRLNDRVLNIRNDLNKQIGQHGEDINRLTDTIAKLNIKIAATEGGGTTASDAVGLRDQRNVALSSLAELINFRSSEQADGTVTVFVGGDYLVFQGQSRRSKPARVNRRIAHHVDRSGRYEFDAGTLERQGCQSRDARDLITGDTSTT